MCELRKLDIRCRGAASLADEYWKREHIQVRRIWKLEDLIKLCIDCTQDALKEYQHFCSSQPSDGAGDAQYPFADFVDLVEGTLIPAFNKVCEQGSIMEEKDYAVIGLDQLRELVSRLNDIVKEERFATKAAFSGGALDDWD